MEFLVVLLVLYFLPTLIACGRGHHNALGIFFLNLFLGWTFLGWIGALIASGTATVRGQAAVVRDICFPTARNLIEQQGGNTGRRAGNGFFAALALGIILVLAAASHNVPEHRIERASTQDEKIPDWKIDAAKAEREAKEGEALSNPVQEKVCPVTADGHHDVCYWRDVH